MKLKKIIFTFILLLFLALPQTQAQSSFPTYGDGVSWAVRNNGMAQSSFKYSYEKDTTFCGYTYSKLLNFSITSNVYYLPLYIRVDNGKVFFRLDDTCSHTEYLMYDFSLEMGDTAVCTYNMALRDFWVHSIDTVEFFGVPRKRYIMIVDAHDGLRSVDWVEGIGSTKHPFYSLYCITGGPCETIYSLQCVDSAGVQLYQDPYNNNVCELYNVGVAEKTPLKAVSVYPNPAHGQLYVENLHHIPIKNIRLVNIAGQVLSSFSAPYTAMDISAIPAGLYVVEIQSDASVIRQKLWVE